MFYSICENLHNFYKAQGIVTFRYCEFPVPGNPRQHLKNWGIRGADDAKLVRIEYVD